MTGRELERDAVVEAIDGGRCAVLYGPAGVGKTRLADACLAVAEARGHLAIRVTAHQAARSLPLGSLAPVLQGTLDADASPAAVLRQARDELLERGEGRAVVFVDDAHLLDTSSALLLSQLLDTGVLFLLATIRDGEDLPDLVAGWWRRETTLRIDLANLGLRATEETVNRALGGLLGARTAQQLHAASGGNPLLLRELVQQCLADGQLSDASGTWRLTGELAPNRRIVDVVASRLAVLEPTARAVVEQLAVCGPLDIAELCGGVAGVELEALERDGLIEAALHGSGQRLALGHPLYGEAIRADLTRTDQRAILLAAADRIEALGSGRREDAQRVATWRLDAGGSPDPEVLLQAARHARHALDFEQVRRLAGLLWPRQPTAEITTLLGEAHARLGDFERAEEVLAVPPPADSPEDTLIELIVLRAQNLQFGLCDWRAALAVVQEATSGPYTDELIAEEAAVWNYASRPARALEVLQGIEPVTPRARVLRALIEGSALTRVGQTSRAIETAVEGFREHLTLTVPIGLTSPGTHVFNQAGALVEAGRFAEADALATVGFDFALNDNLPFAQIWFALTLGKSLSLQGQVGEARRWFLEAASTANLHRMSGPERIAQGALAGAEAMLGNAAAATAAAARAEALPRFEFLRFDQDDGPAWAAWAGGDPARARRILSTSAAEAALLENVEVAAWLWHDAARLGQTGVGPHLAALAQRSDSPVTQARAGHVRAIEADDGDDLAAAARAFEDLGMLLASAEAAYAAAAAHARHGDPRQEVSWAHRAAGLAARCPGACTPGLVTSSEVSPLSEREREIATLAGEGMTSPDIAAQLCLSIRTVNNHLGRVYAKLGIRGRSQLAEALERT